MKKRFKTLITTVLIALVALITVCSPVSTQLVCMRPYITPPYESALPEEPEDPCPVIVKED